MSRTFSRVCSCGEQLNAGNVDWIGIQHAPQMKLHLYNCPNCHTTLSLREDLAPTCHTWLENLPLYVCGCGASTIFKDGCVKCEII